MYELLATDRRLCLKKMLQLIYFSSDIPGGRGGENMTTKTPLFDDIVVGCVLKRI